MAFNLRPLAHPDLFGHPFRSQVPTRIRLINCGSRKTVKAYSRTALAASVAKP